MIRPLKKIILIETNCAWIIIKHHDNGHVIEYTFRIDWFSLNFDLNDTIMLTHKKLSPITILQTLYDVIIIVWLLNVKR